MASNPGELRSVFPTIIMQRRLENIIPLNDRLRDIILEREKLVPGVGVSNVGGWHSPGDFHQWEFPEVRTLVKEFIIGGTDMTRSSLPPDIDGEIRLRFHGGCWVNLLRDGGYNTVHNHAGAVWSGCYYVCTGDPDPGAPPYNGWIEFQDPRAANIHSHKEKFQPQAGTMLIFPGWLNHYVNPFRGKGVRISIAFNFDVEVVPKHLAARNAHTPRGGQAVR
jgi:uncharacterized protein (TIGR02466 family)